ncbi:Crp/Fnr family transcriptional regulator [Brevibacillus sp. SYSU BS000544]|uniref:Crp/Fnr family transcriptional regulator n=1 Tax=Brevibacillus sp. SYSU BS000544 TaxID=3416443 RepID=UPI003CE5406C
MCKEKSECSHHHSCIRRVPIFQNLTDQEIELLQSVTHSRGYERGDFVFREAEQSESLFVLNQGLIKLSKVADNGKEHIIRFLFPGDFFGQFALLQDKKHYANAEIIEPAVVCRIHRDDFKPLMEQNPAMTYRFLLAMSELLQQADEWAGALHLYEVERRLAKLLFYLQSKDSTVDNQFRLPAAKKELALIIGTTPETLSRKLAQFESQGILSVNKRIVRILDQETLSQLAGA